MKSPDWDGTESTRGVPMRGYVYGTIFGRNIIVFTSQDLNQYQAETLAIGERCIESLKLSSD